MSTARLVSSAFSVGLILTGVAAYGQNYPVRPIRIITSAAGGTGDIISRLIAQEITGPLGQPVIVDNRASNLGPEIVAKAPADGYTLLEGGSATWLGPLMQDNVPWDALRDFTCVTQLESSPNVLVVNPSVPIKSVKDLIALAKAKPGALNYSSSTAGGSSHLAGELFKYMAGVNITWVPYKGSAPAALALIAGEVQLAFSSAGAATPQIKAGKMRAIATTGLKPSQQLPDLPLIAETGLPGYEVASIDVILVTAKTPAEVAARLNREIVPVMNRPDVKAKLLGIGTEVVTGTPEQCNALIKSEVARWGKLIKAVGIKVN
jgi:tripartite-type tricarboxylate transporter receptor subunit TctC